MSCSQVIATQEAYASLVWKIQVSVLKVLSPRSAALATTPQLSLDRDEQLPVQSSSFFRWCVGPLSLKRWCSVVASPPPTACSSVLTHPLCPRHCPAPTVFGELSLCCCPRGRLATPRSLGLSSNSSNHHLHTPLSWECLNHCSITLKRHHKPKQLLWKKLSWVLAYSFKGLVHDHYSGKQAGMVLQQYVRTLHTELLSIGRQRGEEEKDWAWYGLLKSQNPPPWNTSSNIWRSKLLIFSKQFKWRWTQDAKTCAYGGHSYLKHHMALIHELIPYHNARHV